MTAQAIIIVLIVGAIAGWLGSVIFKGSGFGLLGNIVIGILGSFVGSWLLGKLGIYIGGNVWLSSILTGAIGAFVILFIASLFSKKS